MSVIDFIITAVFNIIIFIVKIVLLPVDYMIATFAPDLSDSFVAIANLLDLIFSYIGWAMSASGIPLPVIGLVGAYWIFKLTLPVNVWIIKLCVKWYRALKP